MSEVVRLFGNRASAYACFRPHYPQSLFTWLAAHSPDHQRALDIACGSGQASRPLLHHFAQVLACDASIEQLQAADLAGLHYFAADAYNLPLRDHSLDLIVVAQALHWFATPAFFAEASRLLKYQGLFCAWCYNVLRIDEEIDPLIDDFYWNTLKGHWPEGRASVDAGYRNIQLPFARLTLPAFAIELQWNLGRLLGYLSTWSAVQKLHQTSGRDPLLKLAPKLVKAWGDGQQERFIRWPLHFLAGTPHQPIRDCAVMQGKEAQ